MMFPPHTGKHLGLLLQAIFHPSPIPEQEVPAAQWKTSRSACDTPNSRTSPSNIFGLDSAAPWNFFRPAASAQFYLDQAQQHIFPYNGGKLSVSRDNRKDANEVEAYRASFGFSFHEMVTTQQYAKIPDAAHDDGFSISPSGNNANAMQACPSDDDLCNEVQKVDKSLLNVKEMTSPKKSADEPFSGTPHGKIVHLDIFKGRKDGHLSEE